MSLDNPNIEIIGNPHTNLKDFTIKTNCWKNRLVVILIRWNYVIYNNTIYNLGNEIFIQYWLYKLFYQSKDIILTIVLGITPQSHKVAYFLRFLQCETIYMRIIINILLENANDYILI